MAITLDTELFLKNYSVEFEEEIFCNGNRFIPEYFKGIKDKGAKRYYLMRLVEMMEHAQTEKALKQIYFAVSFLHGEDPNAVGGFLWLGFGQSWIDYTKYAHALRVVGDALAEAAIDTDDEKMQKQLFDMSALKHRMALDNFYPPETEEIKHFVEENDQYLQYLIKEANSGSSDALRVLFTNANILRELCEANTLKISPQRMTAAFVETQFDKVISSYSDMVKLFEKRITGHRLVPLSQKFEEDTSRPLFASELFDFLRSVDMDIDEEGLDIALDSINMTVYRVDESFVSKLEMPSSAVIIPRFSILDSGYRGTREDDHTGARYTTRAITTAVMRYGWIGGEIASGKPNEDKSADMASGRKVIQEIDYKLGPADTILDKATSLAVAFKESIKSHAYKRYI